MNTPKKILEGLDQADVQARFDTLNTEARQLETTLADAGHPTNCRPDLAGADLVMGAVLMERYVGHLQSLQTCGGVQVPTGAETPAAGNPKPDDKKLSATEKCMLAHGIKPAEPEPMKLTGLSARILAAKGGKL